MHGFALLVIGFNFMSIMFGKYTKKKSQTPMNEKEGIGDYWEPAVDDQVMKPELKSVWADTHSSITSSILFLSIIKIDLSHYHLMPGMQPTSSVLPAAWAAPSITCT